MAISINARGYRFVCNDCGKGFDEPDKVQEDRGEFWGMPAFETMWYCPCCGSEDFEERGVNGAEEEDE